MTSSRIIEMDAGSTTSDDGLANGNGHGTTTKHGGRRSAGGGGNRRRRRRALRAALVALSVAIPLIVASFGQVRLLRSAGELSSLLGPSSSSSSSAVAEERDTCATGDAYLLESTRRMANNVTTPRRVYTCGWANGHFMARSVFPEFDGPHPWKPGTASTPYDLLLFGAHGPCEGVRPGKITGFRGKILYDNGEPFGDPRDGGPCDYILGPLEDSNTSIRVPFVSIVLGGSFRHRMDEIFDTSTKRRPRRSSNTGEHYMLYAASNCVPHRDRAAEAFSTVGRSPLHLGGKCPLNHGTRERIGVEAPGRANHTSWGDNSNFYESYRFALVLENTNMDGYVTEKILNAFLAGSVPVWGGTPRILDMFNRDAFVYYDESHPEEAVELVRRLEANRTLYDEMLSRPILADGNVTVGKYFSFEDGVGGGMLKRRIRRMLGLER